MTLLGATTAMSCLNINQSHCVLTQAKPAIAEVFAHYHLPSRFMMLSTCVMGSDFVHGHLPGRGINHLRSLQIDSTIFKGRKLIFKCEPAGNCALGLAKCCPVYLTSTWLCRSRLLCKMAMTCEATITGLCWYVSCRHRCNLCACNAEYACISVSQLVCADIWEQVPSPQSLLCLA